MRETSRQYQNEINNKRFIDFEKKDGKVIPCYFNSGCCLYIEGVTCVELEGDTIRLIKWNNSGKEPPYGEGSLDKFFAEIKK